ncbi:hypothetical protein [Kribbella sancticallisti]|uniref:hypothetical protein n=1 Tax=Kribbella sancticallisti TaxID=460087 RepID=UPI0031E25553
MPRKRLPLGTWGDIRTLPVGYSDAGVANRFEARAKFPDLDAVTRLVAAQGEDQVGGVEQLAGEVDQA